MSDSAPITWFTEDPTPILVVGGIALVILLVMLLKTGQGLYLIIMAGIAAFMGLAVLIDKLVVTDRERIEQVVYDAAQAAEQNRFDAVIACISPTATAVQQEARRWIGPRTKFNLVSITGMRVDLDHGRNPPTATAVFHVIASGQAGDRTMVYGGGYNGVITAQFRKEGDRWMVIAYDHDP
jgi:hypothetical protein